MATGGNGSASLFLLGWTVVMVAMMTLATPSLTLLYRTIALKRLSRVRARTGTAGVLAGFVVLWTAAGVPVYAYVVFAEDAGRWRRYRQLHFSSSVAPTSARC